MQAEIVRVTPAIASKWLAEWSYPYQRQLRPDHVRFLADEMRRGTFLSGTQIRVSCENGKNMLVDGQHRLHAVVSSGIPTEFVLCAADSASSEETASQYSNLDIGRTRTYGDMFSAYNLTEELGFTPTQINKIGGAVAFILNGFTKSSRMGRHSRAALMDNIRQYSPASDVFFEVVAGMPQTIRYAVLRAATLSVALVTFRYSKTVYGEQVDDFWRGAVFDDGLKLGDPRKAANKHLMTAQMTGGGHNHAIKNPVTAPYSSRYLANLFNAYIEDRSVQSTKVFEPLAPIKIAGSPFRGK